MTKQIIYSLIVASVFSVTQVRAQKGFSMSVKAVPQFSFLFNKDDKDNSQYNRKTTFNAGFGIGGAYNFTDNLGIGLDVLYSLQGQKYDLNGKEYNQKVDYLKIPLMFTYNTDPLKPVSFIGKIGPQVSFITSSKLEDKNAHGVATDTKDKYKSASFGAATSAGTQFRLNSRTYFTTAVRVDFDFTNAEDKTFTGYNPARAKTYNSAVGLEVGLKYMLN